MAPSSLRTRTLRYGDFINGVLLVISSDALRWPVAKIVDTYIELVEQADKLEIQINNYRERDSQDENGISRYEKLSVLITNYVDYRAGNPPAEWIKHANLSGPAPR